MRTVDNIWILQTYFIHEMGASREDVNDLCGIDEDELDKTVQLLKQEILHLSDFAVFIIFFTEIQYSYEVK